ncbi:MAG TPA: hypothetical protein DDW27_01655 [Bacteroidales bacterium]|nr:hypothetical protein [Bacteroidales bacterium]
MNKEHPIKEKVFSPSRTVWRTQMAKGIYSPHRVSRITCIVNELISEKVSVFLNDLGVTAYIENGRFVREVTKPRRFNLPGEKVSLRNIPVDIFRFTVPRENSKKVIDNIIETGELHIPGRGTIFSQDLMEFSKEQPSVNIDFLDATTCRDYSDVLLHKLSCVVCVLSSPGSGESLAKAALDLGLCVPLVTFGSGNYMRDQLGLIRITISPEKEIVHLVMPEQDSESIIRILIEQLRLDLPGRGFIYQTPVSMGLLDTYLKIGKQKYAATIEQIIAAIDQLKSGTGWRKRLNEEHQEKKSIKSLFPQNNCEISIISDEDRIDILREACLKVGATGAVSEKVIPLARKVNEGISSTMIRSAINVPADITDKVVDMLLEISTIREDPTERIHVLDSPAAYVHKLK